MAATFNTPRALLTTKVARASPSMSSAMIRRGRPERETFSKTGIKSAIALIFLSVIRIKGLSNSTIWRSPLVMK